ncbi:MAG: Protein YgiW [Desulfovibrio sp.]
MKKALVLFSALFTLALFTSAAFAGTASAAERGGFKGPSIAFSTVEQAKKLRDDTAVALRGNIVRHLGKDKYEFQDHTGTVTIEIDDKDWRGVTVEPGDTVEIFGEVDRDLTRMKIEVDRIVKVAPKPAPKTGR